MLPPCGSALAASRTGTVARMSPDCASDDGAAAIRMSVERVTNSGAARQSGGGGGAGAGGSLPAEPPRTGASAVTRSEEHTSELQSLMRNSYAVFCLKKKKKQLTQT